jgi:hypothetical protein
MALKNPPDSLSRVATLSGNIGAGLLSTKSISSNFLKNLLFKLAGDFDL